MIIYGTVYIATSDMCRAVDYSKAPCALSTPRRLHMLHLG